MSAGLLIGFDDEVAAYLFQHHVKPVMKYDRALGIIVEGKLVGGILFQGFNGSNVELSYYGEGTMTPGIIRCIARFLISTFDSARVTVTVSKRKKGFIKALRKLGFLLEGTSRQFYGSQDSLRNTGVRLVMFRDRINVLAKLQEAKDAPPRKSKPNRKLVQSANESAIGGREPQLA